MVEFEYVVAHYNAKDGLPDDVTSFKSQDIRRFTRSFCDEFSKQMPHYEFHDVFMKLALNFDTEVFTTTDGEKWSARLEMKEV